jgi:hypothetical protein
VSCKTGHDNWYIPVNTIDTEKCILWYATILHHELSLNFVFSDVLDLSALFCYVLYRSALEKKKAEEN